MHTVPGLRNCPHDGILLHPVLMGNSIDSRSRVSPSGSAGETATLTRRVLPSKTGPAGHFGMANVVPRRPTCSLHAIPGSSFCPRVPARAVECVSPCADPRFLITRPPRVAPCQDRDAFPTDNRALFSGIGSYFRLRESRHLHDPASASHCEA